MGLAPYGEPRFAGLIRQRLIAFGGDGAFRLSARLFRTAGVVRPTPGPLAEMLAIPVRRPWQPLTQDHMDIAASIQAVINGINRLQAGVQSRRQKQAA